MRDCPGREDEVRFFNGHETSELDRMRREAASIGNSFDTGRYRELIAMLSIPAPAVRRAAAGAAGKLIDRSSDLRRLLYASLYSAAVSERYEQTLQYELRALLKCADQLSHEMTMAIEDIARDTSRKGYVRAAANDVVAAAQAAQAAAEALTRHWCARCRHPISKEESSEGIAKYGKPYCRHCLDERVIEDRNFELQVETAKRLRTTDDVAVQSKGEKRIGDWLAARRIEYVYDERYRIAGDVALRPDFYLPEFDLYIEYWGMKEKDYVARKFEKKFLYQRAGKKLISLDWRDLPRLEETLELKLSRYINVGVGQ